MMMAEDVKIRRLVSKGFFGVKDRNEFCWSVGARMIVHKQVDILFVGIIIDGARGSINFYNV